MEIVINFGYIVEGVLFSGDSDADHEKAVEDFLRQHPDFDPDDIDWLTERQMRYRQSKEIPLGDAGDIERLGRKLW